MGYSEAITSIQSSELTLEEFLAEKGAKYKELIDPNTDESYKVIVWKHTQEVPLVPTGYGFSGGVARFVVLKELGEPVETPRDIDVVAIRDANPDLTKMSKVSEQYMEDDLSHGHGAQLIELNRYFRDRDFVINEVLVTDTHVMITPDALRDMKEKVIRPTEYEKGRWYDFSQDTESLHPKLVMKCLRMQAEFELLYGTAHIEDVEDWQFDIESVPVFYIALQLERAFERGDAVAFSFFQKLIERGTVVQGDNLKGNTPGELAISLNWKLHQNGRDPFQFFYAHLNTKYDPRERWEYYEDLADSYTDINRRITPGAFTKKESRLSKATKSDIEKYSKIENGDYDTTMQDAFNKAIDLLKKRTDEYEK